MIQDSILTSSKFWEIFQESSSTDESRGMKLHEFQSGDGLLRTFSKTHSYGEYIFDWSWAEASHRAGLQYYPKLTSMVPFTPATASHFLGPQGSWPDLLKQLELLRLRHSSAHFLFTTEPEERFLRQEGYLSRDSFQYHFINEGYRDFEDFPNRLKGRKAKHIRNERRFPDLRIERITGEELTSLHAEEMYSFYRLTLEEKGAIPYLTKKFFSLLTSKLQHNTLFVRASRDDEPLAGALFYFDRRRLYGRYWGSTEFVPHLHFELCYYQGMEFCLERNLEVFEAGAQGEHKIFRGFTPVLTRSSHKLNHPELHRAVSDFIEQEKLQIARVMKDLRELLPFRAT